MANNVFANGREISCKAADGKSICAFPDVCFTPPQTPATPPGVPIPYPNTAFAKDATKGSKKVKVSGKEVMLKNKSYFKTSTGDEAGSAPKKGVLTSKTKGKVYFKAWSMDVKFEGENVVRHLDLTTHNHASDPPNSPPWTYLDSMAVAPEGHPCKDQIDRAQEDCKDSRMVKKAGSNTNVRLCDPEGKCDEAMACILVPKHKDKDLCCYPNSTGHHLIEDHWIRDAAGGLLPDFKHLGAKNSRGHFSKKWGPYYGAPTMCANDDRYRDRHGIAHGTGGVVEDTLIAKNFTYGQAKSIALVAHSDASPAECPLSCIESQLDDFYGEDPNKQMATPTHQQPLTDQQREQAFGRFNIPSAR